MGGDCGYGLVAHRCVVSLTMSDLVCPHCGEGERLRGQTVDGIITVTCEQCATVWDRDLTPRCKKCDSTNVRPAFQVLVEKSRGTQLSMQSLRMLQLCVVCDADVLDVYKVSNRPLPPDELPTT